MKNLEQLIFACVLGTTLLLPLAGQAQASATAPPAAAAVAPADMTVGEVRKVDKDSKKITLKHEAIRNLDMPPMTMVFEVGDAAMLDMVKPGDKVVFAAIDAGGGKLRLTQIQPAK